MKPNPILNWSITLRGAKRTQALVALFTGTIDEALSEADVMECDVNWIVREVSLVTLEQSRRNQFTQTKK